MSRIVHDFDKLRNEIYAQPKFIPKLHTSQMAYPMENVQRI